MQQPEPGETVMASLALLVSKLKFSKAHSFDGWLQSLESSKFLRAKSFLLERH